MSLNERPITIANGQPIHKEKRLQQATLHVSHLWFPVNSTLLKKIKKGLEDGIYNLDVKFLIDEIQSDFGLYTFCVKELTKSLVKENVVLPEGITPGQLLALAGLPRIRKVLSVDERRISAHTLEGSSDIQTARLKEAMISATTSELLAEREKIDPELGFSAGLLRQLGLTLVAYNYPTVYRRIMSALQEKSDTNLDKALSEALGFSPSLLALALAKEWKLSPTVRSAMGERALRQSEEGESTALSLRKICEVGEALARANDPEHYPSAVADWETAKAAIEQRLGTEGVKLIGEQVAVRFESYRTELPSLFASLSNVNAETKLHKEAEKRVLRENLFLKNVNPALKKRIKELYLDIESGRVSKETIKTFVREIIPLAGFTGGAIYTIDPSTMMLIPRTKIGRAEAREIVPLPYREKEMPDDLIRAAFSCGTPIVERGAGPSGEMTVLSAALGDNQKIGVFYLELPAGGLERQEEATLLTFKALRQTLSDCLGLE